MSTMTTQTKGSWLKGRQGIKEAQSDITEEQIRSRAYEIYLGRRGRPGDPCQDWLQAERELRARPARR